MAEYRDDELEAHKKELLEIIKNSDKFLPWYRRRWKIAMILFGQMGEINLSWVPVDLWIGVYLAPRSVYICLLPTLPIEVSW